MRDAVVVEAVRTPVGKGKPSGALHDIHPIDLMAESLSALIERTGIDPTVIDDVVGGCVTQASEQGQNITRAALLAAGFPEAVPGTTVDRQCGSSQQAVHFAAQGILAGAYDVVAVAGVESMSRVPMGTNVVGRQSMGERFEARYPDGLVPQGISAELIAARWQLPRARLDEFSASSHHKAAAAADDGLFAKELLTLPQLGVDETVRPGTSVETLSTLLPSFHSDEYARRFPQIDWSITAGNSSPLSDGSAALLLTTSEKAAELGLTPRARLHSFAVAGDDPLYMLTAIIPATRKVLERSGLSLSDIDLFEVNEAFAPVVLAWAHETGADLDRVNVHGGAIALGHSLGASGARIMTTLVHALEQRGARYGLQTMCEAGGLANATIIERI
ncbi:thiolase family protein [Rhodococcus triatomae]|uniref:Acetyl-CoA acyltransferase n=1 Tax=Rhodococcus triatomae TaxID=300028 RepID=A0A1G8PGS4_9NOCA|nr:thiolase family protein [Rhodococcus triatomae]QNG20097.1 thiolase family protein [Rhodococcus triatomae]QNG23987.1 thiolase family protein [Rhodococcus triatomae]SDI91627.1 acetyl-CoA acyltransferase [Rhodococcus triatomae]